MVRAIIFDCFGVLVSESWLSFKRQQFGHDKALSEQATELLKRADAGLLSHESFIRHIADLSGMSPQAVSGQLDRNAPNTELFDYIAAQLKPHYKIGMLSNAAADWRHELFSEEQLALFDTIVLSYESGIAKPDEQAYLKVAEQLDVAPDECVFIDDQERHCVGARAAGMRAIWYRNFEQMKAELEKIL